MSVMAKYVAFLRAINVGGHTVKMDQLRRMFEDMALSSVETFIASGNVIFNSTSRNTKALESKIEGHLQKALGYEVATFIRSVPELAEIAAYNPFTESEMNDPGTALFIGFLGSRPSPDSRRKLESCASKIDSFGIHERELYWLLRGKFTESEFSGARLEKTLGMPATLRNITTVRKIALKYS
jgi:uncharacterized protein (DUF1697 family)